MGAGRVTNGVGAPGESAARGGGHPRVGGGFRRGLFFTGAAGLGALLVWAIRGLPPFGDYRGSYGEMLNGVAVAERRAANVVSAINYDYRALDTLGEEFILVAAVTGVALLLLT